MARRFDDENDYIDSGTSQGRAAFGGTSDFSTMLMSKDGSFFGVNLSPETASNLRNFSALLLPWLRRKTEYYGGPLVEKTARGLGAKDPVTWGRHGRNVIGYTTIFLPQILDTGRNVYDSLSRLNELRSATKQLGHSGMNILPFAGDNEVIANARKKITSMFWQGEAEIATSTISTIPAFYDKWQEMSAENRQRIKREAYEQALKTQNIDDIKTARENTLDPTAKLELEQHRKLVTATLEHEKALYEQEYKAFREKNIAGKTSELKNIISELDSQKPDEIRSQLEKLQRAGIDTERLGDALKGEWDSRRRQYSGVSGEQQAQIIEQFKKAYLKAVPELTEHALKTQFVMTTPGGPFDREWAQYWADEEHRPTTVQENIIGELNELRKAHQQHKHEEKTLMTDASGNKVTIGTYAASLGAGIVSEGVRQKIFADARKKYGQPIAIDRILHLRRVMEQSGDNPPDMLPDIRDDSGRGGVGYAEYVHQVFQQHQKDLGRAAVGERFFEHFDAARWDDNAIQQLPDEQLTAYEYAVKNIAKRIKDGRMDAVALINLVGDKQKKIVRSDGRNFGPKDAKKSDEGIKEAILHLIDAQTAIAHASSKNKDADINEKLGDFVFSMDDFKKAMQPGVLPKEERAFLYIVMSDAVGNDEELGKRAGLDAAQRAALRKEGTDVYNANVDAAVLLVEEKINSDAELSKHITDKQKELIKTLADAVRSEGKHVADLTGDRQQLHAVETVVANALMKGGNKTWVETVEKSKNIPDIIAKAKEERKESAKAPPIEAVEPLSPEELAMQRRVRPEGAMSPMDLVNREEPLVPGGRGA